MNIKKYIIKKGKTDMLSSLKKVDKSIIDEQMKDLEVNSIEELAETIINDFKDVLVSSKNDIATQLFFRSLVENQNSSIFSAYEQDVEFFTVFVYEKSRCCCYYIPDEIRKIIKEELGF